MSRGDCSVRLGSPGDTPGRIRAGADELQRLLDREHPIYGVNTGFGDSYTETLEPGQLAELPRNLVRFHGCGSGALLPPDPSMTILVIRLITLARGYSGVRPELLRRMCTFVNQGVAPVIPAEGSVGASGDLTPLSYLAAALQGERSVWHDGERHAAGELLERIGIEPLTLRPKEALALMNGTSVMTGLLCHAFRRASYLTRAVTRVTAVNVLGLRGNPGHFHPRIFELKPHPGQHRVAARVREALPESYIERNREREGVHQDRYSLRCAPHVVGVLADALPWMRQQIETEIGGVDDNPLLDPDDGRIFHGGNFYGGHMGFVADALKTALASVADLMDRQLAQLVDPRSNRGLPANLVGTTGPNRVLHHGFKALQIASSSWAAEAGSLTMPATVFSRSTENHNQDKVSMGTIGARGALRVLELCEQTVAAALMGGVQALDLRMRGGELRDAALTDAIRSTRERVRERVAFLERDRRLDRDLQLVVSALRTRSVPLNDTEHSP